MLMVPNSPATKARASEITKQFNLNLASVDNGMKKPEHKVMRNAARAELIMSYISKYQPDTQDLKEGESWDLWFSFSPFLKGWFLEDKRKVAAGWEIPLPRKPNLKDAIQMFFDQNRKLETPINFQWLGYGLVNLFDIYCEKSLLYPSEKSNAKDIMTKNAGKPASDVFGCEHFLRFLLKLPLFFKYANLPETSKKNLTKVVDQFLIFVEHKFSSLCCFHEPKR